LKDFTNIVRDSQGLTLNLLFNEEKQVVVIIFLNEHKNYLLAR